MPRLPKFTPLSNNVLVKQAEEMEQTQSGLYIPQDAQEKPHQGEVLAVGLGRRLEDGTLSEMNVTAGDVILFGKYSGQEIKMGNEHFLIISEDDILGVVG
jgi:chaperonin GroES